MLAFIPYRAFLPECLGGAWLPPDVPDYVDTAFCPDRVELNTGTLGFRRWDRTCGFLCEHELDEHERAAVSWGLNSPDANCALILMRLTLYRLPLEHYARLASCWAFRLSNGANDATASNGAEYEKLCGDINALRVLWLRLCFPDLADEFLKEKMTNRANELYRAFWRIVGRGAFLIGAEREHAVSCLLPRDVFATGSFDAGKAEPIAAEAAFRNLAYYAVSAGLLEAIDAYAAGVPADFL